MITSLYGLRSIIPDPGFFPSFNRSVSVSLDQTRGGICVERESLKSDNGRVREFRSTWVA